VFAYAGHLARRIEVEDTACALIRWRSGALGVLEGATSVVAGPPHRLEFHGDRGTILVEGDRCVRCNVAGQDKCEAEPAPSSAKASDDPSVGLSAAGHAAQIADFARAVREDGSPLVAGEDGRQAVELILAVYQSARTGRPVKLPLDA